MPARTKGRAKFELRGRPFIWWVDDDRYLRVSSLDKKFVIAYPLVTEPGSAAVVGVVGPEFPGLEPSERRPVWLIAPSTSGHSMGARVHDLLKWSFGATRDLVRASGSPPFNSGSGRVT